MLLIIGDTVRASLSDVQMSPIMPRLSASIVNIFMMSNRLQSIINMLLLSSFIILLDGCSSSDKSTYSDSKQRLRMSIGGSPQTIDPHQVTDSVGINIIAALSENLLSVDYSINKVLPATAERWEISEDGLIYHFYLRENARWSNGDPVTAHDFVYSWQRLLMPSLGNQFATEYYAIKNAEQYHRGTLENAALLGVHAQSNHVLTMTLVRRDPLFLMRLATGLTVPVHQATVEKFGAMDDPSNQWVRAGNYVGNGPFILADWQINKFIRVIKNPLYWNAESVKLDEIVFDPVANEIAEERLFRAGQLDLTFGRRLPAEKVVKYKREGSKELFSQTDYASYFYIFNTSKVPFDKADVRRAFSLAIDRKLITQRVTRNGEPVAKALTPITSTYKPPEFVEYDPKQAKALLAKAGYKDGKGFPEVSLLYNTADTHRKIAVAIQQMWKKVLNVDVVLENQEWKVFLDSRKSKQFDIARSGVTGLLADPADFLTAFTSAHGTNDTGWGSASFDALIAQSNQSIDPEERYQKLYQAEEVLLTEMPIIPLFYYASNYLKAEKVKGFQFNMLGQPVYKGVYIEEGTSP